MGSRWELLGDSQPSSSIFFHQVTVRVHDECIGSDVFGLLAVFPRSDAAFCYLGVAVLGEKPGRAMMMVYPIYPIHNPLNHYFKFH